MPNLTGDLEGKCNGLLRHCKTCEHSFAAGEFQCPQCGSPREFCSNSPLKGADRCEWHGGAAPKGVAHYNHKGKGLSKYLSTRLLDHYTSGYEDERLLEMNEDIRLLDARRKELMLRSEEIGSAFVWAELKKQMEAFKKARRKATQTQSATDIQKMDDVLYEIERLIASGYTDSQIWSEIYTINEQLRKLRISEGQRRAQAEELITPEHFKTLLGFIVQSIQTRVKDEDVKMALMGDLTSLRL